MLNNEWNVPIPYDQMSTNPKDEVYDFLPMNNFTKKFLRLYLKAECWVEYTLFTVIVRLQNDEVYLYDDLENRLILIKLFDNTNELTESEWRSGFAYLLEKKIKLSGITKYKVAKSSGISNVQLSRYLNERATPSGYVIQRLATAINCDVADILPHDFVPII